ncbi:hypothetical protein HA402_009215 [Bradysia odoriphaga]|nr:hypothetical protein HA402_009215 [Bradysia odoriphaga]
MLLKLMILSTLIATTLAATNFALLFSNKLQQQLTTSSTLVWQSFTGDQKQLEYAVQAAKYVTETENYPLYVCRALIDGIYTTGNTQKHQDQTVCIVSMHMDVRTHYAFDVLLNKGHGGKLTWKPWNKFSGGIPSGAVSATSAGHVDDYYIARRKTHMDKQKPEHHHHLSRDFSVGRFAPKLSLGKIIVNEDRIENEYEDGQILVEAEPIRYELRDIKTDKWRTQVFRNATLLGSVTLANDEEISNLIETVISYKFDKIQYWGTLEGVSRGLPTKVYETGKAAAEFNWGLKETLVKIEVTSKFGEAEDAGTENGHLCSLILADGWTAIEVSVAGLSVVGRKQYGMYGLINLTRDASQKNAADMAEIDNLMAIIGLQYNVDYSIESERRKLRYGKLMMLTDQNERGTHFKGLIINFIYSNWPDLLRVSPPFLEEIITPVVKVTRGLNKLSFYSLAEFERWKKSVMNFDAYTVRHYRGLGTNNWNEIKEYFSNMDFHRVKFQYRGPEDDENLMKAFDKGAIKERREWLTHHMDKCKRHKTHGFQDSHLYTKKTNEVTYSDFINSEYVFFASYNNANSIPSAVDGLKPGHRKVMFTCIKREFKLEVRVSQLAYWVAEDTAYYESEQTVCKFVYDMVHNYVGSNNISLMIPFGQFGTRLMGGEDHADQHSLRTLMSPLTRLIFHPHDDPLLSYKFDEDMEIEPEWYIPVIPMLLVNGCEGTGTGWSTNIPKHDPLQLIRNLRNMIAGKLPDVLTPFYRNFRGTILAVSSSRFITIGCVAIIEDEKIEITELPIGTWTTSYKENVLEKLLRGSETMKPIITNYKEYQTDTTVRFVVSFAPGEFDKLQKEISGFHRVFQLFGIIKTDNMYAFDSSNTLRKFELAHDILQEFYVLRLKFYVKRKKYLEGKLTAEADKLKNQVTFILAKSDNTLVVENKTHKAILGELIQLGYQADPVEKWKKENGIETGIVEKELQHLSDEERTDAKNFDYLLNMSMWTLTEERKTKLINRRDGKMAELEALKAKTEYDLWLADLDELEAKLKELEETERVILSKRVGNKNLYPSDDGKNVEFQLTDELYEEISKIDRD